MLFLNYDAYKIISKQLLLTSSAIGHFHNEKQGILSHFLIVSKQLLSLHFALFPLSPYAETVQISNFTSERLGIS